MHGNNGNASQVLLSRQKKGQVQFRSRPPHGSLARLLFVQSYFFCTARAGHLGQTILKFLASARRLRTACNFHLQRRNRNRRAPTPLEGPFGLRCYCAILRNRSRFTVSVRRHRRVFFDAIIVGTAYPNGGASCQNPRYPIRVLQY